ncbi:MAG: hypothetical protein Q3999_02660 [Buchananella hordeovulneris]|nr:hypothetical protein [Buchananella hordeovulneris]
MNNQGNGAFPRSQGEAPLPAADSSATPAAGDQYVTYRPVQSSRPGVVEEIKEALDSGKAADLTRSIVSGLEGVAQAGMPSPVRRFQGAVSRFFHNARLLFLTGVVIALALLVVFTSAPDALSAVLRQDPASMTFPFAQLVALRAFMVVGFGVLLILCLFFAVWRTFTTRSGGFLWAMALVCALGVVMHLSAVRSAGVDAKGQLAPDSGWSFTHQSGAVTVLVLNLDGRAALSREVIAWATETGADVIVLPESTPAIAAEVAGALTSVAQKNLGENKLPEFSEEVLATPGVLKATGAYSLFTAAGSDLVPDGHEPSPTDALPRGSSTSVLVATSLGPYVVEKELGTANGSVLLKPLEGGRPSILALHAGAPKRGYMSQWRADLAQVSDICAERTRTHLVVAGTLNATRDHATVASSQCGLVMQSLGMGAVGTWPAVVPALLGAPIDGAMVGPGVLPVAGAVIDVKYTDHRAVAMRFEFQ